ncbi:hypothetical protein K504DRAFT_91494 [Pleomassaria siparia CBS 279.74]|uniref:Uncharacterized protein n=1 Tax=Pleomassaria siparia CBS 279.74 TaxID=1314801 RepID=A0A6G1JYY8_9PLEO|nr:hypothetical protein K504DRAFT_91494 [Pleomassaria siparia CBS 279.74]
MTVCIREHSTTIQHHARSDPRRLMAVKIDNTRENHQRMQQHEEEATLALQSKLATPTCQRRWYVGILFGSPVLCWPCGTQTSASTRTTLASFLSFGTQSTSHIRFPTLGELQVLEVVRASSIRPPGSCLVDPCLQRPKLVHISPFAYLLHGWRAGKGTSSSRLSLLSRLLFSIQPHSRCRFRSHTPPHTSTSVKFFASGVWTRLSSPPPRPRPRKREPWTLALLQSTLIEPVGGPVLALPTALQKPHLHSRLAQGLPGQTLIPVPLTSAPMVPLLTNRLYPEKHPVTPPLLLTWSVCPN